MIKWSELSNNLKNKEVKYYYDILNHKKKYLFIKRLFDFFISLIFILIFSPLMLIISILIKISSDGPIFFKQYRITTYGKKFQIIKFRTMINGSDKIGSKITTFNDSRVTKIGKILRKTKLDELPQLFNVIVGQMSFVGTRPEVEKYVNSYTNEMKATLLLPAGITSNASIHFKNEENLLKEVKNIDNTYINCILPKKMKYNLEYIKNLNFLYDILIMIKTVLALLHSKNKED